MPLLNNRWELDLPGYRTAQWASGWEERRLDAVYSVVSPGDVVYDVGAETGDMSALYASWGCRVVVVEGMLKLWPMIRDVFTRNQLHPHLTLPVFAAAETTCTDWSYGWPAAAYEPIPETHPGFNHLDEQPAAAPRIRLDAIETTPDVVTMDVEGSELEVLAGAGGLINRKHGITWFVSIHPDFIRQRWDRDWHDILTLFRTHGYTAHLLDTRHEQHWMFLP